MNDFDIHTLAASYALDALDEQEVELFEAHLPTCEQCLSEVASFRETAAALANAESVEPPESLRSNVLASITTTRQLPPVVSPPVRALTQVGVASADQEEGQGLAAPIDLTERRNRRSYARAALGAIAAAIALVAGIVIATNDDADLPNEVAAVIDAGDATKIPLLETGENLGALEIVYSADESGVALVGDGLEALNDDQTYELWAIDDDGARAVGLFEASDSGDVAKFFESTEPASITWGVTIEPAGGSPQPTTDPLFLST